MSIRRETVFRIIKPNSMHSKKVILKAPLKKLSPTLKALEFHKVELWASTGVGEKAAKGLPQHPRRLWPYRYSFEASLGRLSVSLISLRRSLSIFPQSSLGNRPVRIGNCRQGKKKDFKASILCHGVNFALTNLVPRSARSLREE
ncbi:hypothetical protein CDAR_27151 [Caerostris darwini]|uniref:Uncharacterized protein n=1 Tax=Caerostris darwini TaxID=1538125 RepID=A0AAV4THL6_9ARAC|nr:hypothetical protein CDAR_27151 [Caerostris darwini]